MARLLGKRDSSMRTGGERTEQQRNGTSPVSTSVRMAESVVEHIARTVPGAWSVSVELRIRIHTKREERL